MADIAVGDQLFDEAGHICSVTAIFDVPSPERAFRLTFSDGAQIEACGDHQWMTWTHADRKAFLRSAHEAKRCSPPTDWPNWRPKRILGRGTVHRGDVVDKMRLLRRLGYSDRKIARELQVCRQSVAAHLSGRVDWQGKRVTGTGIGSPSAFHIRHFMLVAAGEARRPQSLNPGL